MHEICENIFSGINTMFVSMSSTLYQGDSNSPDSLQGLFMGLFLMMLIVLSLIKIQEQNKVTTQKGGQIANNRIQEDN